MDWKELVKSTDWNLLKEQKEVLEDLRASYFGKLQETPKPDPRINHIYESLEGILSFLDCIQDAAEPPQYVPPTSEK